MNEKFWKATTIVLGMFAIFIFVMLLTPTKSHTADYQIHIGGETIHSKDANAFHTAVGELQYIDFMCSNSNTTGCQNLLKWSAEIK